MILVVSNGPVCGRCRCSRPGCVPALGLLGWCIGCNVVDSLKGSRRESGTATCLVAFWFLIVTVSQLALQRTLRTIPSSATLGPIYSLHARADHKRKSWSNILTHHFQQPLITLSCNAQAGGVLYHSTPPYCVSTAFAILQPTSSAGKISCMH